MAPPPDRDVLMGPPPIPPSSQPTHSQHQKDGPDIVEKYRRLKRRYQELEEKHKETNTELQRSGERNVRMREERNVLLDRIIELESQPAIQSNGSTSSAPLAGPVNQPQSSAFPRSLLSARAQSSFISNLRTAVAENDMDEDVDPLLTSRHVGPLVHQRTEEQERECVDEGARGTRRSTRKTRHSSTAHRGRAQPASSTGTRSRVKRPASDAGPSNGASDSPSSHSRPASVSHSGDGRSESPPSPAITDISQRDEYLYPLGQGHLSPSMSNSGYAPSPYYRASGGNGSLSIPGIYPSGSIKSNPGSSPVVSPSRPIPHQLPPLHGMPGPSPPSGSGSRSADLQRHGKPKRLKAHTVTTKSYSIPTVPRDKAGKPMLPLNVGIMTVISLGDVCMREHFHTERYIFPVGYEVTRRYHSTVDPAAEVVYHCTILDGGDGPKFQIVPSDTPDQPVIAGTATGAWSTIVKKANAIRNRQHSNSVSGPDFFGLGQNTIKHLIQELPCADRLRDYVWQNFVEGGPLGGRHAAVIPALPEEYDATIPIGAYYPDRRQSSQQPSPQRQAPPQGQSAQALQQQQNHHNSQASQSEPQSPSHHQGLTQIVLPPPTTSDTFTIQEYRPPASRDMERRVTRASTRRNSSSPVPGSRSHRGRGGEHRRSPSDSSTRTQTPTTSPAGAPGNQHHSPYAHASAPASPPPVPPTFASIMNAYPAPASPLQGTPPVDGYSSAAASD